MISLTARQQEVLDFIKEFINEQGMPPTRADIANALGFRSANAAEDHLKALARKGAIELMSGASRGIRLPEEHQGLPIVGRVAAGEPVLAVENVEDYAQIPSNFFYPEAHYLLRVHGMSMKDIGILDGDLLAVHRSVNAENGQVVVARIEEEVTVKRFRQRGNIVTLIAENADFEPIKVDLRQQAFAIEGLAVGVIRQGDKL